MAEIYGADHDGARHEEWVHVGDVMPLRTRAVDLRVTETPDGGLILEVRGRDGVTLAEPTSVVDETRSSGFAIRVAVA